jgi:hypothetical protein
LGLQDPLLSGTEKSLPSKKEFLLLFYSLFIILFNKKKKGIGTNLINGCLPSISSSIIVNCWVSKFKNNKIKLFRNF